MLLAAILQYPINATNSNLENDNKGNRQSLDGVSWLILADHRPKSARTMTSSLTADKLSATLEQQLRTLSIKRLEGIVVQTGGTDLTNKSVSEQSVKNKTKAISSELLSLTAMQLSQSLPTKRYWQAGNFKAAISKSMTANESAPISTQNCVAGKAWQSANGELSIQAITGWSTIDDSSVWDCSLAIDSDKPIRVLQYNAANPMQSLPLTSQTLIQAIAPAKTLSSNKQVQPSKSRLILDVATHQRLWQLWLLICTADELPVNASNTVNASKATNSEVNYSTTWLTHSDSTVPKTVLIAQQVEQVISYDNKSLEVAFALNTDVNNDDNVIK